MLASEPIADHRADLLADMFRLLGDPSRLKLVLILCQGPSAATAAAVKAGLSPQLASHHLRLLKAARLVRAMRKGREIHYDIADDHVRHMLADMVAHVSEPHHEERN
ncbi:MAG: ArsR/SmtB family transcription factor [Ferrovibrio sp.]|uniref:ArsR/SmtB family transcription factor n=1 Tax=Ferrovibrio sp. TaxID=1917215 RepID=UPI00391DC761